MVWLDRMRNKFRANVGIVSLDSPSSEVEDIVDAIARNVALPLELQNSIFLWDFAKGFRKVIPVGNSGIEFEEVEEFEGCLDPVPALDKMDKYPHSGLFIFRDIHPFLMGDRAELVVISAVKNLSRDLPNSGVMIEEGGERTWTPFTKRMVILGQDMSFPNDFFNVVHHLHYSPPEQRELEEITNLMLDEFNRKTVEAYGRELEINLSQSERQRLHRAALSLTKNEYQTALQEAVITYGAIDSRTIDFINAWKIEKLLVYNVEFSAPPEVPVGGFDLLDAWIEERVGLFHTQLEAKGAGVNLPPPKGILLVGPPGTGKSLCAKSIGQRLGLPIVRIDIGGLFDSLVGETGKKLRQMLRIAETISPCVLWLDEVDKALAGASGPVTDGGTAKDVLGTLLTWMADRKAPVFVVATANRIDGLPSEFSRSGRFNAVFKLDVPTSKERAQILDIHLGKYELRLPDTGLVELVRSTKDWVGAELADMVEEAVVTAQSRCIKASLPFAVELQDFKKVLERMVPQAQQSPEAFQEYREHVKNFRPASTPEEEVEKKTVARTTTRNIKL
ncbi:AAA family ATPase [Leptolyngbya sp. FACHB-541]|uniref:AAA family ATPase n=1 Tax=Leptolyngbya sp. FACHB-541 TaxID=2692810 RepID=UPI00168997AF|nr:AAA family ATPase [Leptolyngbya sp. FACHB-541]MBD1995348.1 AAA family ATPase [Leptolyngbya sp. FACHB-541]